MLVPEPKTEHRYSVCDKGLWDGSVSLIYESLKCRIKVFFALNGFRSVFPSFIKVLMDKVVSLNDPYVFIINNNIKHKVYVNNYEYKMRTSI